jgi:hypothetical protein
MIYTHVLNRGEKGVRSPLDQMGQHPAYFRSDCSMGTSLYLRPWSDNNSFR